MNPLNNKMWHSPVFDALQQKLQEEALVQSEQLQTYMKEKNLELAIEEESNKYKVIYEQSKKGIKGKKDESTVPTPIFTEKY